MTEKTEKYAMTIRLDPVNKARFDWLVELYGGGRMSLILRLIQDGVADALDKHATPEMAAQLSEMIAEAKAPR